VNYLELLKLASPEVIVVITALAVLAIDSADGTRRILFLSPAESIAVGAVLMLPQRSARHGISSSAADIFFKIICLALAFHRAAGA
jgi:NADH:ubiquinone oxidoreductase subunit 2 (subunit N)